HAATTHIYDLSLHDALPIFTNNKPNGDPCGTKTKDPITGATRICKFCKGGACDYGDPNAPASKPCNTLFASGTRAFWECTVDNVDRKSTRLNSSHQIISYAV